MTAAEILSRAETLDPIRWIEDRASKDPDGYADGKEVHGKDDGPAHEFTIPFNLPDRKPLPRVCLAFLPTIRSWEIPALLSFGDWNECPPPDVHIGLMKHWYEQYGAEFVGVTEDVIEMRVTQPPADPSAAQTLAREQFLYCSDIVHQGVGTTRALASLLQGGTAWYFWWD